MGWSPWDKVVTLETAHGSFQHKLCSSQKKIWGDWRVWKGHKRAQKKKSCWESQFCSAERRQDWEVVWEWPSTGKKSFIVKATLLPVPDYIHNNELKLQRETGRAEIGEYLMLKKMPLTGKETRRGWALSWDRGITKMKKNSAFFGFLQASTGP